MAKLVEAFLGISRHGDVNIQRQLCCSTVPLQSEATVCDSSTVDCYIVPFSYCLDEMYSILAGGILYSKVIHPEGEHCVCVTCFHNPGMCVHSMYPCRARHFLRSFLARISAWRNHFHVQISIGD